jgi:YidC/Oxa1 family membrane protein insertase
MGEIMGFLYMLTIYPIESLIDILYVTILKMIENQGFAIIGLSFAMSVITFPLYQVAESLQKKERDIRNQLRPQVERVRAVFTGDERFLILATLYKQHKYHPIFALRTSLGLLIQVPFFIAAYQFLSHMEALQGARFLIISNLGEPDQLIRIGAMSLNILPILMTLCNLIAGAIYSKGFQRSEKIQLYGLSLLFLILLYRSPAALVLYWTLNNLFSLGKTLLLRLKNPWKFIHVSASILSIAGSVFVILNNPWIVLSKIVILVIGCFCIVFSPLLLRVSSKLYVFFLEPFSKKDRERDILFGLAISSLILLCGFLIPTNIIASSPTEFAFAGSVDNPLQFVGNTFFVFLGLLGIWGTILYLLFGRRTKTVLSFFMTSMTLIAYGNLFLLSYDLGTINSVLQIEVNEKVFPTTTLVILGFVLITCVVGVVLIGFKLQKTSFLLGVMIITAIASLGGGIANSIRIQQEYAVYRNNSENQPDRYIDDDEQVTPVYSLSRSGRNVFVLILDRAISSYFPLVMEQQSGLQDSYLGFVYYPNTVSSGAYTVAGTPPLLAGYEYTPDKMNQRSDERLVDKHNEALLMLSKNFMEANFSVTITDPPLPNYQWRGDLSPFENYPQMKVMQLEGDYSEAFFNAYPEPLNPLEDKSQYIATYLPRFSLLMTATPLLRPIVYDEGKYLSTDTFVDKYWEFIKSYSQLFFLKELTEGVDSGNTFTIVHNNTTHEPALLEYPSYEPRNELTNTDSPISNIPGVTDFDVSMYHVNAAALIKVGNWLDYLKELGVYDNSRIIILSDHGRDVYTPAFASFSRNQREYAHYNALLLVKDFNSKEELQIDMSFMTTADLPLLAIENLGVSEINTFTGNTLSDMVDKSKVGMYYTDWNPPQGNTFSFVHDRSFFVHDNIFDEANWSPMR